MLTVIEYLNGGNDVIRTVVRTGSLEQCQATRDALLETLERGGFPVDPGVDTGPGILSVATADTDDATIVEGDEVVTNMASVVKRVPQIAPGA